MGEMIEERRTDCVDQRVELETEILSSTATEECHVIETVTPAGHHYLLPRVTVTAAAQSSPITSLLHTPHHTTPHLTTQLY